MKIVQVVEHHSENMGYSDVCLSKKFSSLDNEMHVVTTTGNVYFGSKVFKDIFSDFLGSEEVSPGYKFINGYHLHRLKYIRLPFFGVYILNLSSQIDKIKPDIIQTGELISLSTFQIAILSLYKKFIFTTEVHIHKSVFAPCKKYLELYRERKIKNYLKYFFFIIKNKIYRIFAGSIISFSLKSCYPISEDAAEIASDYLGISKKKIKIQTLGTDCSIFYPNKKNNKKLRCILGYNESDFVIIYTGRLTDEKKPDILAKAINVLNLQGHKNIKCLFIGSGYLEGEILKNINCKILKFMPYSQLADYYNLSDLGVWPAQESTSQIDILACGKPIIIDCKSGTPERANGSGYLYETNSVSDLADKILKIKESDKYDLMCSKAIEKVKKNYSWEIIAKNYINDYKTFIKN
jgi:glycosyltransferase involved in cell wall biosynthesis